VWRGTDIDIRETNITKLLAAHPNAATNVATVSLGDEITIIGKGNTSDFHAWCKQQKPALTPKDLGCSSGGWSDCPLAPSFLNVTHTPALYYWSMKFLHSSGIVAMKTKVRTRTLQVYCAAAHSFIMSSTTELNGGDAFWFRALAGGSDAASADKGTVRGKF
jgi:hypothetical protein